MNLTVINFKQNLFFNLVLSETWPKWKVTSLKTCLITVFVNWYISSKTRQKLCSILIFQKFLFFFNILSHSKLFEHKYILWKLFFNSIVTKIAIFCAIFVVSFSNHFGRHIFTNYCFICCTIVKWLWKDFSSFSRFQICFKRLKEVFKKFCKGFPEFRKGLKNSPTFFCGSCKNV